MGASRLTTDGDSHYISFTRPSAITTTSTFSICAWAKSSSSPVVDGVLSIYDGSGNRVIGLNFWSGGNGAFAIRGTSNANARALSASVTVTDWHHWAVTYDGSSATPKIYVDGVDLTGGFGPSWSIFGAPDGVLAGKDRDAYNSAMRLAHLEVFERELAPEEVANLVYRPGSQPPNSIWAPIFGLDSPEIDWSGNGSTGTINGTCTEDDEGAPVSIGGGPNVSYGHTAPIASLDTRFLTLLGAGA